MGWQQVPNPSVRRRRLDAFKKSIESHKVREAHRESSSRELKGISTKKSLHLKMA